MAKSSAAKGSNPIYLVLNVIFSAIIGVAAWFGSPALLATINANTTMLSQIPALTAQIILTVALFVLGLMVVSIIIAMIKPKDKQSASAKKIAKEQDARFAKRRESRGRR